MFKHIKNKRAKTSNDVRGCKDVPGDNTLAEIKAAYEKERADAIADAAAKGGNRLENLMAAVLSERVKSGI